MKSVLIEVCIDSVESAVNAVRGGASRLELCGNLGLGGGTTPSLGLFKAVQKVVEGQNILIMVMIRPRTGDFLYSESEMQVMLSDIRIFKKHGVQGFVFGALTSQGRVDMEHTRRLVDASLPAQVCFHRAFDMTRDAKEAMDDLMNVGGITRILTSGQGISASESLKVLISLFEASQISSITLMPGSGINPSTIGRILDRLVPLGLSEVHLSGGGWVEGEMGFRRHGLGMGVGGSGEWGIWKTDSQIVGQVKAQIEAAMSA